MQSNDLILTLVFLGLAIFVIVKLRGVLGQRTGHEKPPQDLFQRRQGEEGPGAGQQGESNVVSLHNRREPAETPPDPTARLAGLVSKDSPAGQAVLAIMDADATFDPAEFVGGAKAAYEMIVMAFANGDRKTLKDLLAKDVYDGFDGAITEREKKGERVETQFVSIDKAEISDALLRARSAQVTVRFLSKLVSATRDANGTIIEGNAEKVIDVTDIWTFSRDVTSRDPNWRLIATESAQ